MTCLSLFSTDFVLDFVIGVNIFSSTPELFNIVRQHLAGLNFPITISSNLEISDVNFTTGEKDFFVVVVVCLFVCLTD